MVITDWLEVTTKVCIREGSEWSYLDLSFSPTPVPGSIRTLRFKCITTELLDYHFNFHLRISLAKSVG